MKYKRVDILQLIDLAFKGLERDARLREHYRMSPTEIIRTQDLMRSPDVLLGLDILFNCVYPQFIEESPILQTARQYALGCLELTPRTCAVLQRNQCYGKISTVADLLRLTDRQLTKIRGIGPNSKAFQEIRQKRRQFLDDYHKGRLKNR